MAEPIWTNYVAIATGIIGAITGIAGAIMGYVSYRRSNKLKAFDLRLELRKAANDVHADLARLRDLFNKADKSRQAVNAAMGMSRSGAMVSWQNKLKADRAQFATLHSRLRRLTPPSKHLEQTS
jgi:hypothetical protein